MPVESLGTDGIPECGGVRSRVRRRFCSAGVVGPNIRTVDIERALLGYGGNKCAAVI